MLKQVFTKAGMWYKNRFIKNIFTLTFVALGPILAGLTFKFFSFIGDPGQPKSLNIILLIDLIYVIVIFI